jgi:aryl-alcohol dehydrogenase-like predicted oxidoreductase
VIATKVGMDMGNGKKGLSKAYILKAVEASLQRLQTDYIDLYQSHVDDVDAPFDDTFDAYAQLIKQGKVRVIGASNYSVARLQQAMRVSQQYGCPSYQCLQPEYNLYRRHDFEGALESACLAHGMGVISYFSLASGFLTGKYRSQQDLTKSARGGGVAKYLNERGFRILDALDETAKQYHATPAQIALAWLIARPSITAPIASATSIAQLDELVGATRLQLDQAAIDRLNLASA